MCMHVWIWSSCSRSSDPVYAHSTSQKGSCSVSIYCVPGPVHDTFLMLSYPLLLFCSLNIMT